MRTVAVFAVAGLLTTPVLAQTGPGSGQALIPYTGVLEQDGTPIVDARFDLRFGLYSSAEADPSSLAGETPVAEWWDELIAVPVSNGRFAVALGQGAALDESLFLNDALYLAVAVRESESGQAFTLLQGLQRLGQVPFAVRVERGEDLQLSGTTSGTFLFQTGEAAWKLSGHDLSVNSSNATRGDGGRALVLGNGDTLVLNYDSDFAGGTAVRSDLVVTGDIEGQADLDVAVNGHVGGNLQVGNDLQVGSEDQTDSGNVTTLGDIEAGGTIRWHCPQGMSRVGTWCIDDARSSNVTWHTAVLACHNAGKSLCPYEALMLCDEIEPAGSTCSAGTDDDYRVFWTSTRHGERDDFGEAWQSNLMCYAGNNSVVECHNDHSHEYVCCVPGARL